MEKEKILKDAVLAFFVKDGKVLLGIKMKKIGKGKLNGHGGGIEEGETPEEACIREVEEETRENGISGTGVNIFPEDLIKTAEMSFHNQTEEGIVFICKVHVFLVKKWEGEIRSTEDLSKLSWYKINNIPKDMLMPADPFWLPIALSGKKIVGKAEYTPRQEKLVGEVEILEVSSF